MPPLSRCALLLVVIGVLGLVPVRHARCSPEALIHSLDALVSAKDKTEKKKIAEAMTAVRENSADVDKALAFLKTAYEKAEGARDKAKALRAARVLSLLGLACKRLGKIMPFANVRIIFWGRLYGLAAKGEPDDAKTLDRAAALVKTWAPLVDDLFNEVMVEHGRHKAGKEAAKTAEEKAKFDGLIAQDLKQLRLLARAARKGLDRADLAKAFEVFEKDQAFLETLSPVQRKKMENADRAMKRATAKYAGQEWTPARDVFALAYGWYKELGAERKLLDAAYWMAVVHEKTGEYWAILGYLKEAMALAKKLGNRAKYAEMEQYGKALRQREQQGEFSLVRSPLCDPAHFEKTVETVPLAAKYNLRVPSPHPQRHKNFFFWRNVYLADGEYLGKPADRVKLPFPGLHYWIKRSKSVVYATNAEGQGGVTLRLGTSPGRQAVQTVFVGEKAPVKVRYEFMACLYRTVKVCERTVTYPVDHSKINVRITSNTYRKGKFQGSDFVISDDNTNGWFTDFGTDENPKEPHENDVLANGADSIFIGRGSRGRTTFLGSLVRFGDAYYEMKLNRAATEAAFRRYVGPVGKVRLVFQGPPSTEVRHFIVQQRVDDERVFFVNVAGARREPVPVPAGVYFFKYGEVAAKGLWFQVHKGSYPSIKVREGETTVVEFGGPFKFHVPVKPAGGDRWEVKTYEMFLSGVLGEVYWKHWPRVLTPSYQVRDGKGRLVAKGKLQGFQETDELTPPGMSHELLYMHPKHVTFEPKKRVHVAPYKVHCAMSHPILGAVKDAGYK